MNESVGNDGGCVTNRRSDWIFRLINLDNPAEGLRVELDAQLSLCLYVKDV